MLKKILFFTLLGISLADKQRRFLFGNNHTPFPNSPFGGGGSGGSPFGGGTGGGSGGVSSPFGSGSGSGGQSSSYSPCVPTHSVCSLQCPNGYVKGPGGCDFCMCNNNAPSVTTYGPVLVDPVDAKVSTTSAPAVPPVSTTVPTTSSNTTAVDCIAAKLSCASSCGKNGYLVDPSDCTFCLCKSSM